MRALTYVELDIDYCTLTYGVPPCQAVLGVGIDDATFDGTNDYLARGAGLTGAADSKLATFSGWIRMASGSQGARIISSVTTVGGATPGSRAVIAAGTTRFALTGLNAAAATILDIRSSSLPTETWLHLLGSVDLNDVTKRHIYINDVSDLNQVNTWTDDVMDFTMADWGVGAYPDGSGPNGKFNGVLAQLWYAPGVYIDFSIVANRRKFISSSLLPADLGDNGELPTGTAPLVFLNNPVASWHTNLGSGGGFTLNGALADYGATGAKKCFNTLATCQDTPDFTPTTVTMRFAKPCDYLPASIDAIPSIESIQFTPATVSLGEDLGERATLTVVFRDHRHSDTGPGGDKYLSSRPYNPFTQGTFFGKFRIRQPFLRNHAVRWINGSLGQELAAMETHNFAVESFDGPKPDGSYRLIAKDILKFADGDRAQAPPVTSGLLLSAITNSQTTFTLTPSGIGNTDDYPPSGYVAIGTTEIASYTRDALAGNDANTLLLIHCDGVDATTAFTDVSASARTVTTNGGAQVDTAQSVFGGASALFDGTGDFLSIPDSADWQFSGQDFAFDMWVRLANIGSQRDICGQSTDANNGWHLYHLATTGKFAFEIKAAGVSVVTMTGATNRVINTWYHVAVTRTGTVYRLFVDGVQDATTTDADVFANYTGTLNFGRGLTGGLDFSGWLDEIRVSKVARWSAAFDPPEAPYETSADLLRVVRGQLGTTGIAHAAGDRVQVVLYYLAQDVADIIYDLLVNYADVDPAFITLTDWTDETALYLGGTVYTAIIHEPAAVKDLISELIEQVGLVVWWDDIEEQVRLRVLRPSTAAVVYDEDNVLQGTIQITDQPEKRLTQVWTYFALRVLTDLSQEQNYVSVAATVDLEAEGDYGSAGIKKIFSRWIPVGGRAAALAINARLLARFRDPPRRFQFSLMRGVEIDPQLGGGYSIRSWSIQTDEGEADEAPVQLTRVNPMSDIFAVEAEEVLGDLVTVGGSGEHIINIDSDINNVNLRTIHDALYSTPTGSDVIICYIAPGVIVGSVSTATPAFDVGSWPAGADVTVVVQGRIEGHGGAGGDATGSGVQNGNPGGTALYTRYAIDLEVNQIWGGGGGGGGALGAYGFGGSGGGGQLPGSGGTGSTLPGNNGSTEAGGASFTDGSSATNGAGGAPGSAGGNGAGTFSGNHAGGAAGNSIDGVSFVTVTAAGSLLGPQVN